MYDRVLLAADGSEHAREATSHAIHTAKREMAVLHVLFIAEKTRDDPETTGLEETVLRNLDGGEEILEDVVDTAGEEGVGIRSEVSVGVPSEEIRAYANENEIDLNRDGFGRHLRFQANGPR